LKIDKHLRDLSSRLNALSGDNNELTKDDDYYLAIGSGCGHWSNKRDGGGGCCVPECRYHSEYGRIEDNEVITSHRELEEEYRKRNRIVNIDISPSGDNYTDYQKLLKNVEYYDLT